MTTLTLWVSDTDFEVIRAPTMVEAWINGKRVHFVSEEPTVRYDIPVPDVPSLVRFRVRADGYRPVQRVMRFGDNEARIVLPINPSKARPEFLTLPEGLDRILAGEHELQEHSRAGLWNIWSKMNREFLDEGKPISAYAKSFGLIDVAPDRFYVQVNKRLPMLLEDAAADPVGWKKAASGFHDPPGEGYKALGSYKTEDNFGNLQAVIWAKGQDRIGEFDIDDGAGIAHIFQVVRNHLSGGISHPFDIREILVRHQDLNPGYRLRLREGVV